MKKYIKGFTLAEVLITLSILGVVAVIVIPSIIQRITDRQTVTAVKRAYSMIDNAIQQMYVVEGLPSTWSDMTNDAVNNSNFFAEKLAKYLSVSKYCGSASGCFNGVPFYYTTLDNKKNQWGTWSEANTYGKILLKNGMMLAVSKDNAGSGNSMGEWSNSIRVDINGKKSPNRYGYDVFFFRFGNNGILNSASYGKYACSLSSNFYLNAYSFRNGFSCSMWILKHNNMDYKYRDVSSEW